MAVEPYSPASALIASGADRVEPTTWEAADAAFLPDASGLIIGNPPFSLAEEHIALALSRMQNGHHLTLLLRAAFLAGKGRHDALWNGGCLRYAWHVDTQRRALSSR